MSNTITHLKTYMNLEMGVGSLDVNSNGLGLIQNDTNNGSQWVSGARQYTKNSYRDLTPDLRQK